MPFPPTDKSMEGVLRDTLERVTLVERRLGRGSTTTTPPAETLPPLPDPQSKVGPASNPITSAANAWVDIAGVSATITPAKDLWVRADFTAMTQATTGYVGIGVAVSVNGGAFSIPTQDDSLTGTPSAWGQSPFSVVRESASGVTGLKVFLCPAGVPTTFKMQANRSVASGTQLANYGIMRLIPMYYAATPVPGGTADGGSGDAVAGIIAPFGGSVLPAGWLWCDGAAYSRTAYAALYSAIGTAWGAGNGSSTFNVPDLRGRTTFGRDAAQTEFDTLGETGGSKDRTLLKTNLPSPIDMTATGFDSNTASTTDNGGGSIAQGNTSGRFVKSVNLNNAAPAVAFSILPPYGVANYIISTGSAVGGGGSNRPALPAPIQYADGGLHTIASTSVFGAIVPGTVQQSMDVPYPMWALITFGGWLIASAGETRGGVAVGGATVLAPQTSQAPGNPSAWGQTVLATANVGTTTMQQTGQKLVRLNAGINTFQLEAYIITAGNHNWNYPVLEVTPIAWDGEPADVITQDTGWISLVPLLANGFLAGTPAPAYRVKNGVVHLTGVLYRATAPTSFTVVMNMPAEIQAPSQFRVLGRTDHGLEFAITNSIQLKATAAATSGIGWALDGISWIPIGM